MRAMGPRITNLSFMLVGPSLILLGCSLGPDLPQPLPTADRPYRTAQPSIVFDHSSATLAASPRGVNSTIMLSSDGTVILRADPANTSEFQILDTTGNAVQRFGRHGAGPGEFEAAFPIGQVKDRVWFYDLSLLRLTEFLPGGASPRTIQLAEPILLRILVDSERALGLVQRGRTGTPAIVSLRDGATRTLIPRADSFLTQEFGATASPRGNPPQPTLGIWDSGFVVANGRDYHLGLYLWSGKLAHVLRGALTGNATTEERVAREFTSLVRSHIRNISARVDSMRLMAELRSHPLPYFWHVSPLGIDGDGRIWVVGPIADSAYADIFLPERYVGRIAVPCRGFGGSWTMSPPWIAFVCESGDSDQVADATIKVFRIKATGSPVGKSLPQSN